MKDQVFLFYAIVYTFIIHVCFIFPNTVCIGPEVLLNKLCKPV